MTTLEKLGILGIRSFSPETLEVLAFEKPLTLIVGHNGAGKTTIVECLKMATTGELPPNAGKGQNFVHNPRATEAPEVKGQIRLVFRTSQQKKILATRSFQLTNTLDRKGRLKTSYKALDSVLQVKDDAGNIRSINKKCIEMDQQVPQFMGVSKAVLENVIFCHQEDSNWPLSEMPKLKKKFDDLFGATRYSRALESIGTLRKEHQKIAKEKWHRLEVAKTLLEQATSLREKIDKSKAVEEQLENTTRNLQTTLKEKDASASILKERLEGLREIELSVEVNTQLKRRLEQEILQTPPTLLNLCEKEPLELLIKKQETLSSRTQDSELSLAQAERNLVQQERIVREVQGKKDEAQTLATNGIRLEERLKDLQCRRLTELRKAENILGLAKNDEPLRRSEENEPAVPRLRDLYEAKREEFRKLEAFYETRDNDNNIKVQRAHNRLLELLQNESAHRERLQNIRRDIAETQTALKEGATIEEEFNLANARRASLEETRGGESVDAALSGLETEIQSCRLKREKITNEMMQCKVQDKQPSLELEVQVKMGIIKSLRKAMNDTKIAFVNQAARHKSQSFSTADLDTERTVENALMKLNQHISEAISDCVHNKRQHSDPDAEPKVYLIKQRLEWLEQQLTKDRASLSEHLSQLDKDGVNPEIFPQTLKAQEKLVENALTQLLVAQNAEKLYTNHLTHSVQKGKCAFCTRNFANERDQETFKSHIQARTAPLPAAIERKKNEYNAACERLLQLKSAEQTVLKLKLLKHRIEELETEKSQLFTDCPDQSEPNNYGASLEVSFNRFQELVELKCALQNLKSQLSEIRNLEREIDTFRAAVKPSGRDENKDSVTIGKLQADLQEVEAELSLKERELHMKRESVLSFKNERAHLEVQIQRLQDRLQRLSSLRASLESKTQALQEAENFLKTTENKILSARDEQNQLTNNIQSMRANSSRQLQEMQRTIDTAERSLDEICNLESRITETTQAFKAAQGATDRLQSLSETLEKENALLSATRERAGEAREELDYIRKEAEQLRATLQVMEKKKSLQDTCETLRRLKENTDQQDPTKLRNTLDTLTADIGKLNAELARCSGERKSHAEWRSQHETELHAQKFRNIDVQYRDALLEAETQAMAIRDLQKYYTALDKALMKYHTVKMQEINRTIRELWQTVYKGSDIDSIAIRSDTDEELQFATTGLRSYNYRVTMMKDGTEMEMRGRCSAGQKVLASIVIRLALAESFCINCGILALDEPTTNLDRSNMDGLAQALAELIEARRNCSHFQLILITHDEEFVRMLARHQPCDSFFQIKKSHEGYTTIRRADIRAF